MARIARIVIPGAAHPVTQRGNNNQDVFFVEDDKRVSLDLLRELRQRFGVQVESYGRMTNRIQVAGIPETKTSLPRSIGRTRIETLEAFAGDSAATNAVRRNTYAVRPLGSGSFLSKLKILLDRRLHPFPIERKTGWRKVRPKEQGKTVAKREWGRSK